MASTTILSDNGVSSGVAGLKTSGGNDGSLALQTTTAGGVATTAVTIGTNQVATFAQAPVLPAASIPQAALATNVGATGPAFSATTSSAQSFATGTNTKLACNTEAYDTNSNYDTSLYRFTPTVAGYYQVSIYMQAASVNSWAQVALHKNGSQDTRLISTYPSSIDTVGGSALVYLNGSTDYVEAYGIWGATQTATSKFQAFLARAA